MRAIRRFACCLAASWASAAAAQTAPPPPVTVDGSVAAVSDYRYRGLSQSALDPALQGSLEVTHRSGLYAGAFVSTIAGYVVDGADPEIDLYAGVKASPRHVDVTAGLIYYIYAAPRGASGDYAELYATAARTLGPATAKAGVSASWRQRSLGLDPGERRAGLYLYGELGAGIPRTPFTVTAHFGRTVHANAATFGAAYADWSLGAAYDHKALELSLAYVDTDTALPLPYASGPRDVAGAGVVAAASLRF